MRDLVSKSKLDLLPLCTLPCIRNSTYLYIYRNKHVHKYINRDIAQKEDKLNEYGCYGVPRMSFNNWLCFIKTKYTYIYSKHFYRFLQTLIGPKVKFMLNTGRTSVGNS